MANTEWDKTQQQDADVEKIESRTSGYDVERRESQPRGYNVRVTQLKTTPQLSCRVHVTKFYSNIR